jgi:hypothetical protein
MTTDAIREKFAGLVAAAAPDLDVARVTGLVRGIADLPDISELPAAFAQ